MATTIRTVEVQLPGFMGPRGETGATGPTGPAGSDGTMTGPVSSTDNAIVRWNGTAGTTVQDSSVWVVDDSGRLIANSATAVTSDPLEVWATSAVNASFGRWTANTTAFILKLHKSRGTSVGTHGLVSSGDRLGEISFRGSDGDQFYDGGMIRVEATGVPANNSIPARMIFMTSSGASTQDGVVGGATAAWEIDSSQVLKPSTNGTDLGTTSRRIGNFYLTPTGSILWSGGGPTLSVPSSTTALLAGRMIIDGTGANTNLAVIPGNSSEGIQPILFQTKGGTSLHPLIVTACGDNHAGMGVASFGASSGTIYLAKSAGSTFTDFTAVSSGNTLGEITWNGSDSIDFAPAASIYCKVDGTPGSDDMPGKIIFATTADGAATVTDRWSIDSTGLLSGTGSVIAHNATAIPAGGTAGAGLRVSSTSNFGIFFGSGAPTLSAAKGSLYLCSNGSTTNDRLYVNTNGGTTWTAVTTVA